MAALRIVFMGTPELARTSLEALLGYAEFELSAVVTQPDRPKGRDLKLQPSPVKQTAQQRDIPVLQPERARNEEFIQTLETYKPELIAVAAYGQILPKKILDMPRFGCLNVHTSLLPKYRGAAPIQWALLNDEPETGVTIMKMDVGMDTGDILTQERTPISAQDNSETLHDRLAQIGARLLVQTIPDYVSGTIKPRSQPADGVSYASKITKQHGLIDWTQPARTIWNRVRGLIPWPGAFTHLPDPVKPALLKIWQAEIVDQTGHSGEILEADKSGIIVACGQGALRILVLQREGSRRLPVNEFLAGCQLRRGETLA
jgi:methionyl-tRNA formyltransferase